MGKIGIWELLIVLVIALLIFGPKSLPKLGESVGKTISKFKKALNEDDDTAAAADDKAQATQDDTHS